MDMDSETTVFKLCGAKCNHSYLGAVTWLTEAGLRGHYWIQRHKSKRLLLSLIHYTSGLYIQYYFVKVAAGLSGKALVYTAYYLYRYSTGQYSAGLVHTVLVYTDITALYSKLQVHTVQYWFIECSFTQQ
jgi:hypothetical protein